MARPRLSIEVRLLRTLRDAFPAPLSEKEIREVAQSGRASTEERLAQLAAAGLVATTGPPWGQRMWIANAPDPGVSRDEWLKCEDARRSPRPAVEGGADVPDEVVRFDSI